MRPASQPSTSKALSSSRRWLAFGMAESSCSGIEMRSIVGVPVSTCGPVSVAQPEPTSVWSISTSNDVASTATTCATERNDEVLFRTDLIVSEVCGSTG